MFLAITDGVSKSFKNLCSCFEDYQDVHEDDEFAKTQAAKVVKNTGKEEKFEKQVLYECNFNNYRKLSMEEVYAENPDNCVVKQSQERKSLLTQNKDVSFNRQLESVKKPTENPVSNAASVSCDILDLPKWFPLENPNIGEYCLSILLNDEFDVNAEQRVGEYSSITTLLKDMDTYLRSQKRWSWLSNFLVNPDTFEFYLKHLVKFRNVVDTEKFYQDAKKFRSIYESRKEQTELLTHCEYWGSRQQMLSGKVIGDFVAGSYGPIDPVFGVLLNPTTGRLGRGDSHSLHAMLHNNKVISYHAIVHDAFGYLKNYHDVGPGYDYLGSLDPFENNNPLAGQGSGLIFWRAALKKIKYLKKLNSSNFVTESCNAAH